MGVGTGATKVTADRNGLRVREGSETQRLKINSKELFRQIKAILETNHSWIVILWSAWNQHDSVKQTTLQCAHFKKKTKQKNIVKLNTSWGNYKVQSKQQKSFVFLTGWTVILLVMCWLFIALLGQKISFAQFGVLVLHINESNDFPIIVSCSLCLALNIVNNNVNMLTGLS